MAKGTRGRKPSIALTASKLHEIRRTLKSLVTEIGRLEQRVIALDTFYRGPGHLASANSAVRPGHRRGPNVRDLAHEILSKKPGGLPIPELSAKVAKMKGKQVGVKFAQNLGAALMRDRRFKRLDRGVYAVK